MKTTKEAYNSGKDCAINGADEVNCYFTNFATKELMESWNEGYKKFKKG